MAAVESELHTLYNTLNKYKMLIAANLDKIDESILQAVNNYENTFTNNSPKKKYNMSMEVVGVLQHYLKMLYTSENLVKELRIKFAQQERRCYPERDENRILNQFPTSPFNQTGDCLSHSSVYNCKSEVDLGEASQHPLEEVDSDLNVESEIETLVGADEQVPFEKSGRDENRVNQIATSSFNKTGDFLSHLSESEVDLRKVAQQPLEEVDLDLNVESETETLVGADEQVPFEENGRDENRINQFATSLLNKTGNFLSHSSESEVDLGKVAQQSLEKVVDPDLNVESEMETTVGGDEQVSFEETDSEQSDVSSLQMTDQTEIVDSHLQTSDDAPERNNREDGSLMASTAEEVPPKSVEEGVTEWLRKNESLEYTAQRKLEQMTVYNRRHEAEKKYENKGLCKDFKWTTVPVLENVPNLQTEKDKKTKAKHVHYDIVEDTLFVKQLCTVIHVESPSEFYVRINQPLFEKLEIHINQDLNNKAKLNKYKSKKQTQALLGKFCFCYLPKRAKWFRVEVKDWTTEDPDSVLVQLIDYGEKVHCKYQNLRGMTDFYSKFPRMALKCRFCGIYSLYPEWSRESINTLVELSEMKQMSKFVAIYVDKEGDTFAVDLMKKEAEKTLAQILVERGLACEEEVSSVLDDLDECDNINEIITGYDARDEARICPFTDRSGRCFKGAGCKLEHGKLSRDGITTDKVLTLNQALTTIALPLPEEWFNLLITGYISTCHFYVQIIKNRSSSSVFDDEFQNLRDMMKSNNLVQTYETFKVYPGVSEIVLVKEGLEWHRGSCVGYTDDDNIEVFLVDYGYKKRTKLKNLRQMKEDYLYLPFQAVECILSGCQEKSDVSREVSLQFFTECMHLQTFTAYVVESGEPLKLVLWDVNNINMDHVLKNYGLGQDRNVDVFPSKACILSCD